MSLLIPGVILLVFIFGLPLWLVMAYNRLVSYQVQANESWSGIDVQLKRRHNLIPNLESTVKAYAQHEHTVFTQVADARAQALQATGQPEVTAAENQLTQTLRTLFALAEAYPDLKANQNFLALQNSLKEIEDQIQMARRYYNAVVRLYNTQCRTFPSLLAARMFKFLPRSFFEIEDTLERQVPRVDPGPDVA